MICRTFFRTSGIKLAVVFAAGVFAVFGFAEFGTQNKVRASVLGPSPGHTNAPGESNCTQCHSDFPVNSGSGSVTITGVPANYRAGEQIPVTVTTSQADAVIYGFQLTALDSEGKQAGTFSLPTEPTATMQISSGFIDGGERKYVMHTANGVTPAQFGSRSWTFTWTAPAKRSGKMNFYAAGNAANSDSGTSGDRIYTGSSFSLSGSGVSNYDSDAKSDLSVYRPSNGTWYTITSGSISYQVVAFGEAGDVITPGDYDGDGKTDRAVWRPSNGTWHVMLSGGGFANKTFGENGDIPVQADYDGDLKTDFAVWRPSNGTWYIFRTSDFGYVTRHFGENGDNPVPGDFDGDGRADYVLWRPSNGNWYSLKSAAGSYEIRNFGVNGDIPLAGDFDGDGSIDLTVYRPSDATWYGLNVKNGYWFKNFGEAGDVPAPADFDGDGSADLAIYRNGTWYVFTSTGPSYFTRTFGEAADIPVARGYFPQ
jgi:hypothetical protein